MFQTKILDVGSKRLVKAQIIYKQVAQRTVQVLRISGCTFYAFTGAFTGVAAIMSMVMIGYDRYNVIVKVKNKYCFKMFLCGKKLILRD